MRALPYFLAYLIPFSAVQGYNIGGWGTFQSFAWIYVFLPIVDWLGGLDRQNRTSPPSWFEQSVFLLATWLAVPVQTALIIFGAWAVTTQNLTMLESVGVTLSIGAASGAMGITVAHELIHRTSRFERELGAFLMCLVSYGHFCIEHVHGHHQRVGTPVDPASARAGENIYAFLPRTLVGSFENAWKLETARQDRRHRSRWTLHNRVLRYIVVQALMYGGMWLAFGPGGIVFFAVQGAFAIFMLEVINYLEHYGLRRHEISPGRYEPVDQRHSWNSSHRVSNWFLFNLARHTDHHWHAGRRYAELDHIDDAPQLPAGYGTMFMVALVPPLWFAIMDKRLTLM
jgi:alkane 1-monooxygenase